MNESTARAELAKHLKHTDLLSADEIPEWLWQRLGDEGYVQDVEQCDGPKDRTEEGKAIWDGFCRAAKTLSDAKLAEEVKAEIVKARQRLGLGKGAGIGVVQSQSDQHRLEDTPSDRVIERPSLNPYEQEHAVALSTYLARRVASLEEVSRFRTDFLDGAVLTREQAGQFFRSPLTRFVPATWLTDRGVVPLDYTATIVDRVPEAGSYRITIATEPDLSVGDVIYPQDEPSIVASTIAAYDEAGRFLQTFWPQSVLHELRRLAAWLMARYPWDEPSVIAFVLSGASPLVPPLMVSRQTQTNVLFSRGTITIEVEPWVSVEAVAHAFVNARDCMFMRDKEDQHIIRPRQRATRPLEVFRFVEERTTYGPIVEERTIDVPRKVQDRDRPSWHDLLDEWNVEYPAQQYSSYQKMCRDYTRGRDEVIYTDYRL